MLDIFVSLAWIVLCLLGIIMLGILVVFITCVSICLCKYMKQCRKYKKFKDKLDFKEWFLLRFLRKVLYELLV